MGCSRGVPGLFRAVPGVFRGCSGVFRGCSGVFRGVPGFTDTPRPKRPRAFIYFLVFGNRDETLALVFEIVHNITSPLFHLGFTRVAV